MTMSTGMTRMLPRWRAAAPAFRRASAAQLSRALSSTSASTLPNTNATATATSSTDTSAAPGEPTSESYFKITLTRSAIGLGASKKATLTSLGIHRRMQTVFHPHKPEFAGKILAVKELVRVENVGKEEVKTKTEMRRARRPPKGFEVVGRLGEGLDVRA